MADDDDGVYFNIARTYSKVAPKAHARPLSAIKLSAKDAPCKTIMILSKLRAEGGLSQQHSQIIEAEGGIMLEAGLLPPVAKSNMLGGGVWHVRKRSPLPRSEK